MQGSAWEDNPSLLPDEGQAVGTSSAMLHVAQPQPSPRAREGPRESPYASAATASTPQAIARQSEAASSPQAIDSTPLQQARLCLEAPQSATRPTSSADVINTQDQASSALSAPPWPLSQSHAISYFVIRTPNGFLITDFPPGYTFLILTPTQCQVLTSGEGVNSNQLSYHDEWEHQQAPFAFKVKPDGDVEAINLPVGTEITKEVVELEPNHLFTDRQARVRTTFTAVDDYTVCFEGHVALAL